MLRPMDKDKILDDYQALCGIVTNVFGFNDLAEHFQKNDSVAQLKACAYVYAGGHVLARRVFSLSHRLDEADAYPALAEAFRPLRQLCAAIIGANAWVDDDAAPEDERLICHAQAYAKGYELALRLMEIDRTVFGSREAPF
jgi:hypothetical protein